MSPGTREMQHVMKDGKWACTNCPQCGTITGLWLCIQPPGEYARTHGVTDVTASLLPPEQRAEAMRRSAEYAEKSTATPWITCVACGYDDHYVIGASR